MKRRSWIKRVLAAAAALACPWKTEPNEEPIVKEIEIYCPSRADRRDNDSPYDAVVTRYDQGGKVISINRFETTDIDQFAELIRRS